jgi:hypothetical protein
MGSGINLFSKSVGIGGSAAGFAAAVLVLRGIHASLRHAMPTHKNPDRLNGWPGVPLAHDRLVRWFDGLVVD